MTKQLARDLELQIKISKLLSIGFVFSIVWLGGIGSLIAFVYGLRARKLIKDSDHNPHGIGMAWWCIIVGALGTIVLPLWITWNLMNPKNR